MRKDFSRVGVALFIAAPLFVSSALAGESSIGATSTEQEPVIALVVLQGLPGSAEIMRGSYQEGLDKASAALAERSQYNKIEMAANVCAAQIKLGRIEEANGSCEFALANNPIRSVYSNAPPRKVLAVAHVNHGVVHFVQGDNDVAEQEFLRATTLYPSLQVAESNLALTQEMMGKPRVEVGETL